MKTRILILIHASAQASREILAAARVQDTPSIQRSNDPGGVDQRGGSKPNKKKKKKR